MHISAINDTVVTVYNPAPIESPIIPAVHKPTDVVNPFIWFFDVNSIEFPLSIAVLIIVAVDKNANTTPKSCIKYKSINIAIVEASDTNMNVLNPAECLFIERSQPIIAENIIDTYSVNWSMFL